MAAQKKNRYGGYDYGAGAVDGSLAYDFNHPALNPEYDDPFGIGAQPEQAEWTAVRTRSVARQRTKQSIAPVTVLGFAIAAVLLVTSILARVQLVELSATAAALETQLSELTTEQTRLQIEYESAYNLTEIEEYATSVLGMQKPTADQIYYIDTSAADKAVVIGEPEGDGLIERIENFIAGIGAYFRG